MNSTNFTDGRPDEMVDRYVYLHVDGMTIHVKLDDEGVVVDAWQDDEVIATACKTYSDMGIEVKESEDKELN